MCKKAHATRKEIGDSTCNPLMYRMPMFLPQVQPVSQSSVLTQTQPHGEDGPLSYPLRCGLVSGRKSILHKLTTPCRAGYPEIDFSHYPTSKLVPRRRQQQELWGFCVWAPNSDSGHSMSFLLCIAR